MALFNTKTSPKAKKTSVVKKNNIDRKMTSAEKKRVIAAKKNRDFILMLSLMTPEERIEWSIQHTKKEKKAATRREIQRLIVQHGLQKDVVPGWKDDIVFEEETTFLVCSRMMITPINLVNPKEAMLTARRNYILEINGFMNGGAKWDYKKSMNVNNPPQIGEFVGMVQYQPNSVDGTDLVEIYRIEAVEGDVSMIDYHVKTTPSEDTRVMTLSKLVGAIKYSQIPSGTGDKIMTSGPNVGHYTHVQGTNFKKIEGGVHVNMVYKNYYGGT